MVVIADHLSQCYLCVLVQNGSNTMCIQKRDQAPWPRAFPFILNAGMKHYNVLQLLGSAIVNR